MKNQPISSQQDIAENGNYAMLMHILVFVPYINWLIILIMWLVKKDESPLVRQRGNILMNLFLTVLIFVAVFYLFLYLIIYTRLGDLIVGAIMLVFIGFVLALIILMNIIDNAIRANKGQAGSYVMAFKIFNNKLQKVEITTTDHLID
jgi:uncharacterized Tic20 family protein